QVVPLALPPYRFLRDFGVADISRRPYHSRDRAIRSELRLPPEFDPPHVPVGSMKFALEEKLLAPLEYFFHRVPISWRIVGMEDLAQQFRGANRPVVRRSPKNFIHPLVFPGG